MLEFDKEDVPDQPVPEPWKDTGLSDDEKEKMNALFAGDDETKSEPSPIATQEPKSPEPVKVEMVDWEFEGEKLAIPASMKEKLEAGLLRQADYSRKTQEVARGRAELEAARKAIEANPVQLPEWQNAELPTMPSQDDLSYMTATEQRLFNELEATRKQVDSIIQAREIETRREVLNKLDEDVQAFKREHSNLTEEQLTRVLAAINEDNARGNKRTFERYYSALYPIDEKSIREDERRKYADELKGREPAAMAPVSLKETPEDNKPDVSKMTDDQVRAGMLKELGW